VSPQTKSIYVLTDTPAIYRDDLGHSGAIPIFVKDIGDLLNRLKDVAMAGLVLELGKVMKASRQDRDRLFNYAGNFPVLRTKVNPRHGFVAYLDSRDSFFRNLDESIGMRFRNHERISVRLGCTFSAENDPIMTSPAEGVIHDISPGGCFVNTRDVMPDESFIHVKIPSLKNSRPIFSSIRWSKGEDVDGALPGMGIMFIDLTDEQVDEIRALQLTAQVR